MHISHSALVYLCDQLVQSGQLPRQNHIPNNPLDNRGMDEQNRLIELLVHWEDQYRIHVDLDAEELCRDCPELVDEIAPRIERRRRLLEKLDTPDKLLELEGTTFAPLPIIPGYELYEVLGTGATGVVYKARQIALDRVVAIKLVGHGVGSSPSDWRRICAEAEMVAKFQHPNIVQIHEVGQVASRPYLTLEYVASGTLSDLLQGQPVSAQIAASITTQLAVAVHHAHERGIIHRDIKPTNVLMTADGTPKLTDFGLAKRLDIDLGHTQSGTILGTPCYMAPEQAYGRHQETGPATDVYALGVVLYQMLTGRVPFVGETLLETLEQVRAHDPVPPRQLGPKIPRDLETICLKCLDKSPAQRYSSAQSLADDLSRFIDGETIHAQPPTLIQSIVREVSRRKQDFPKYREWSNYFLAVAPIPPLIHLMVMLLYSQANNYPYIVIGTTFASFTATQLFLVRVTGAGIQFFPQRVKRLVQNAFNANLVAELLTLFGVWWTAPADQPMRLLFVYPIWTALIGIAFFAIAAELGYFYIIGAIAFALTIPGILFPEWSPVCVSLCFFANVGGQGLLYRWLAAEFVANSGARNGPVFDSVTKSWKNSSDRTDATSS